MRIRLFLLIFFLFTLSTTHNIYASDESCGEELQNSQNLSMLEVQDILKKMNKPDATIVSISVSPVYGLYEVVIQDKGRYEIFYVDFSKIYLIRGPIIELSTGVNKSLEQLQKFGKKRQIDLSRIPLEDALILGDRKARLKVIVFTDPDCPFCEKLHGEMKKVEEKRKDVVFYIKLFPLKIHPDAYWKSKSIRCSNSLKLLEDNFEKKPIPKPNCEAKEIDENIKLANGLGIGSVPTMIMPDGTIHEGYMEADRLIDSIDSSRTEKK